jgi:hypothetical protein
MWVELPTHHCCVCNVRGQILSASPTSSKKQFNKTVIIQSEDHPEANIFSSNFLIIMGEILITSSLYLILLSDIRFQINAFTPVKVLKIM